MFSAQYSKKESWGNTIYTVWVSDFWRYWLCHSTAANRQSLSSVMLLRNMLTLPLDIFTILCYSHKWKWWAYFKDHLFILRHIFIKKYSLNIVTLFKIPYLYQSMIKNFGKGMLAYYIIISLVYVFKNTVASEVTKNCADIISQIYITWLIIVTI